MADTTVVGMCKARHPLAQPRFPFAGTATRELGPITLSRQHVTSANHGCTDYSLANPDTLTKYKVAAEISQKVLKEVSGTSKPTRVAIASSGCAV
jgi:hypothetical protein